MANWADKTIDNKTEWTKRDPYKGAAQGLGVQDNRFHLNDGGFFTYGYDNDWIIGMNESDSRLIIKHKNQTIENCFYETGLFLLEPKVTGVIPAVAGAISNIYKESGDGEHSVYQLHQAAATSGWWKILNSGDVIDTDSFSGNDRDDYAVPSVKAVKDFVNTAGVANSIIGCSDTNITTPADGSLMIYDTGTAKWIDRTIGGDARLTDVGGLTIENDVITFAKMQDSTAEDVIIGRGSGGGAGDFAEIACTANGRAILASSNLSIFDWYKFGAFSVTGTFLFSNNENDKWYAVRPGAQDATIVSAAGWDPDAGGGGVFLLETHQVADSIFFRFPKAGVVQGIQYSYCTNMADLDEFRVIVTRWDLNVNDTAGSVTFHELPAIEEILAVTHNLDATDQYKYFSEEYIGLDKPCDAGDGIMVHIKSDNDGAKPDMHFSMTITGSYT